MGLFPERECGLGTLREGYQTIGHPVPKSIEYAKWKENSIALGALLAKA
jgi:hypothetical protein